MNATTDNFAPVALPAAALVRRLALFGMLLASRSWCSAPGFGSPMRGSAARTGRAAMDT